jgi:glutamine amidotransferase
MKNPQVAIVDYGMGNLFSVQRACQWAGLTADITCDAKKITQADAVILPGVGAFGDAMGVLRRLDLISVLQDVVESLKPLMGICLGMQLLMSEGFEFGHHRGLDFIKGKVIRFENPLGTHQRRLKVPQVGWNQIYPLMSGQAAWKKSLLDGVPEQENMYFVHSYYVVPQDDCLTLSISRYGHIEFCSSLQYKNIFACQFHPERSGQAGLRMYNNLAQSLIKET